jgi:hypothetical protein
MGRLSKKKVDEIKELLKQGYLDSEIAELVGVHSKTVAKYDPNRQKRSNKWASIEYRVNELEEGLKTCLDWLEVFHTGIQIGAMFCPRCIGDLELNQIEFAYVCKSCGHKIIWPLDWCVPNVTPEELSQIARNRQLSTSKQQG